MRHAPRWLKYAGLLMLIALILPLAAACGSDDDDADPTNTTAAGEATNTAPAAGGDATPTEAEEEDATATEGEAGASPEASPTEEEAEASPTEEEAMAGTQTFGPFTNEDVLFGKEQEEGEQGGTFIEGSFSDISTLLPIVGSDTASSDFQAAIFESLIIIHPDTLEPVGLLAESWDVNEDATVFTYYLRDGVTWSDGEPFTANDVMFSYDMYMNEATGSPRVADFSSKIESMEVVDDQTITFNLIETNVDFNVQVMVYGIIAEHIWADVDPAVMAQDDGATGLDPARVVGTGPFLFSEWIIEDRATAVRNDNYWNGAPYLDEYIFKVVPDQAAGVAQLQTGEIDYFEGVPESSLAELEGSSDVTVVDYPTVNFTFYGLNLDETKTTLFQDVEVRQALLYALDREAMLEAIRFGYGEIAVGTMPTLSWAYNPAAIENDYPYDPELAAQLLDEAGWVEGADGIREKDGQRLAFTMYTNAGNLVRESYLTILQEYWAAIGVEMTPQLEPFPALVERITETFDFEAILIGFQWGVDPDQSTMFSCDATAGAGFNMTNYCNEEVDSLLQAALVETDREARIELYTQFQNVIVDELPVTILDFPQGFTGVSNRVHNVYPSGVNARFNMHLWWVEQ
ncbi:MAG: peptide-binding protein [Thermomicrobiales bacterium]